MEQTTIQSITLNEFFEKHKETLQTTEGKHGFCNFIDYISSYLNFLEQVITISKKASETIITEKDIIFTISINFKGDIARQIIIPSKEQTKEAYNKYYDDQNKIAALFKESPYRSTLNCECQDPKIVYNFLSVEKIFNTKEKNTTDTFKKALEKNLIPSLLNTNEAITLRNNSILLLALHVLIEIQYNDFPYHCTCSETHINHLQNVCLQSPCIKQTPKLFNFSSKWKIYKKNTLIMMTDLLNLLSFYEPLCSFFPSTMQPFTKPFFKFYYNKDAYKNCITSYEEIKRTIDYTTLDTLQTYYQTFYSSLNTQDRRRSPLIFGPLEELCQIPLTNPNNIFEDFILKTDKVEQIISSNNFQKEAYKDLLQEHYANKIKKKTDAKKKNEQKSLPKKNLVQKNLQNKKDTIASSNDYTNLTVQSSAQSEHILKKELKTKLKKFSLTYDKDYLNRCLAENDTYHDFPFILDQLVILYGIAKKDMQDKNAMIYYWPIAYTTNANNTEYAVYKVASDKNNKSIFHRGPITLTSINKLRELRTNPVYFEKILNDALPTELLFDEKEFPNQLAYLAEEYYETIDSDNQVIIKNPFKGPFGSKITEINERYVVIKSLDTTKTVYFPLIM